MASAPKYARIVADRRLSDHARFFALTMADDGELGFRGGQYIIIHTAIEAPDGGIVKRPYSILSSDRDQCTFQLAVRHIPVGIGSRWFQEIEVGTELCFSGPWGKWTLDADAGPEPTLVLATDTGITAALGLWRSREFDGRRACSRLVWCTTADDYFLPGESYGNSVVVERIPPADHPERVCAATAAVERATSHAQPLTAAFLVGDGKVLIAVKDRLLGCGVREDRIRSEFFFNRPPKTPG